MLTPGHRDELHQSGLSDETIGAAGLYSTRDARDLVGWSGPGARLSVFCAQRKRAPMRE